MGLINNREMSGAPKVKKINTKKKFVADGVFRAELNEFLTRTLGEEGYAGIEVRATSMATEIRVRCAQCKKMLAKPNRKIKEIKSLICKRYNFNETDNKLDLSIKPLAYDSALCAIGCEVKVAGKVRGQRAKSQKYTMGYQVSTGQPKHDFIDKAIRHVELRQGMIGIQVKIMQATEIGTGVNRKVMPDTIKILDVKEEDNKDVPPTVVSVQATEVAATPEQ